MHPGNAPDPQASGAYIFRPNGTVPFEVIQGNPQVSGNSKKIIYLLHNYRYLW